MADDGILGLLGRLNDPAALYGGALTDPATKQAMAGRGLLAMAGSFADSAMPTRMPTPIGAVLGHAAAAAGTSGDTVMEARLRNAQAQQAMASTGLLNQLGPAYQQYFEAARKEQERLAAGGTPAGGIPSPPAPGAAIPSAVGTGPAPTGPIDPKMFTAAAVLNQLDPLLVHTTADIESSYGTNTGNKISPSNTGVFQLAKFNEPGGQNDTYENQVNIGAKSLATTRDGLRASLGREPTNAEVYLAHQQGVSGAYKLITNPDTPAGKLVPPVNISNNAGNPNAPASTFVQHWEQAYTKREGKFKGALEKVAQGDTSTKADAAPPPQPPGLLNVPDLTGQMNAPIPGIADNVAPGAPAAAAAPPSAGDILVAANQRTSAAGGLPPLPPGLPQMADASGQVPPGPILLPGGRATPGLLQQPGAAPPPPAAPPQVAAGPQPLVTPPPPAPPVPPAAMPPTAPPPLNLPPVPTTMPAMPGGGMPPVQATPLQMIAQGIVGLSSLTGHPAPEFMQKIAGQPVEMQMEAYKAYVGAQANQMTAKYQKELDASAAQYIAYQTSQGNLPADLTKMTTEQNLKLRNDMLTNLGLVQKEGHWQMDPAWLAAKAQTAGATAMATETAKNTANLGTTYPMGGAPPAATPPGAAPPGAVPANEPAKGTASPYGMLPPLSEQRLPASADEAKAAIPSWNTRVDDWTKAIQPAQQAELRMMTIAQAFKSIQSGAWATQSAAISQALLAVGIPLDRNIINDPAKVQLVLHENILTTLPILKAATRNPTQTEFVTTTESREHPNIQPEANLEMLSEDIALMRQSQNLPAAFHASGWQNASQFESAYLRNNPLGPAKEAIKKEIGQLKGMPGWVPPPGSVTIGHDPMTKDTIELKNNQWMWTSGPNSGKPYVPPAAGGR